MFHILRAAVAASLAFALVFFWWGVAQAADLWFSDANTHTLRRVDTTALQITLSVPLRDIDDVRTLAIDPKDGSLWALGDEYLLKLDVNGSILLKLSLKNLGMEAKGKRAAWIIDPYDGSLWLADNKKLTHLDGQGRLLGGWTAPNAIRAIALSLDQSLWVLGHKNLAHYSAQGVLLTDQSLQGLIKEEPKLLAVDSLVNRLWLAGEKQLIQFDLNNLSQPALSIVPPREVEGMALDQKSGTLWLIVEERLVA